MEESKNIEPGSDLTEKQRRFCEFYVFDWNGTQAAIKAGYSEDTARQISSENLTKPNIRAYVSHLKTQTAELAGISPLMVAMEYKKMAVTSAANLKKDWYTEKEWDELTEDEKAIISEIEVTERTIFEGENAGTERKLKFKTYNKQTALAELKKMFGYDAAEKKDITSNGEAIKITLDLTKG